MTFETAQGVFIVLTISMGLYFCVQVVKLFLNKR